MSNSSLKEQLEAVANSIETTKSKTVGMQQRQSQPVRRKVEQKKHQPRPHTHVANAANAVNKQKSTPKPQWLDYARYGVELLQAYFPGCFKPAQDIQPLKVGIKIDLVKRLSTMGDIVVDDKACMVKSLAFYVNTAAYHKKMVAGAMRIDLDGNEAAQVTAEEAAYSKERYQKKFNKNNGTPENISSTE